MTRTTPNTMIRLIRGGRVIDPATGFDGIADVEIDDSGHVAAIHANGSSAPADIPAAAIIDAKGMIVGPGFIDLHTHLREPGREDEETVATGSAAGVYGGYTTLCCMPNTDPPIADQETVRFVLDRAMAAPGRVYPVGAITREREGESLAAIAEMVSAGAVALSDDGSAVSSPGLLRRAMGYAQMFGVPIASHCETPELAADGVMNEGLISTKLGLRGIPPISEQICLARDAALAKDTGARLHICHVSTAGSVEIIRRAKADGIAITAEVTPHHLILTDELIAAEFDPMLKVNPPLCTQADVEALRAGLADGTIDCIATDHAPHAEQEKDGEFDLAPFGMIGLETALSVCRKALIDTGIFDWPQLIARMSTRAARIFGIGGGMLKTGLPADIVVIDPEAVWTVSNATLVSKSKNSPYLGWELKGRAHATLVEGRCVHRLNGN